MKNIDEELKGLVGRTNKAYESNSVVYLSFFNPSSQAAVARFVYGQKDLRKVNQKPIIDARKDLMALGYIKRYEKDEGAYNPKLNPLLISTPKPLIHYIRNVLNSKSPSSKSKDKEAYALSKDEELVLSMIIDSKWFRSFVSEIRLNNRRDTSQKGQELLITNAMGFLADILDDIASLTWVLSNSPKIAKKMPSIEDLRKEDSFDSFAEKHVKANFTEMQALASDIIKLSKKYCSDEIIKDLKTYTANLYFLCVPKSLTEKLMYVGRIELTLIKTFAGAFAYLGDGKKYSSFFDGSDGSQAKSRLNALAS
ncbi:hypothetical protein M1590_01185 [Candidatus Marsarchaeota archaeon]|nr:hypothetical protein [Candidatus Marsarchaeota archaeon]